MASQVYINRRVPANDDGSSLDQATVGAARLQRTEKDPMRAPMKEGAVCALAFQVRLWRLWMRRSR
jgi:hypothetical protein